MAGERLATLITVPMALLTGLMFLAGLAWYGLDDTCATPVMGTIDTPSLAMLVLAAVWAAVLLIFVLMFCLGAGTKTAIILHAVLLLILSCLTAAFFARGIVIWVACPLPTFITTAASLSICGGIATIYAFVMGMALLIYWGPKRSR
jgi:hypothetical protein